MGDNMGSQGKESVVTYDFISQTEGLAHLGFDGGGSLPLPYPEHFRRLGAFFWQNKVAFGLFLLGVAGI